MIFHKYIAYTTPKTIYKLLVSIAAKSIVNDVSRPLIGQRI